jgi:hypothetical protein
MKRRMLAGLSAAAFLIVAGGSAEAHERTFRSTVEGLLAQRQGETNNVWIVGQVRSPRPQCVPDRRIKIFAVFADGSKQLKDVARTSNKGYFGTFDDYTGAVDALLRVTAKNVGRGRHVHRCEAASDTFEDAPAPAPAQP